MSLQTSAGFRFGGFLLDHSAGGLFRLDGHGGMVPIMLGSRALDVLGVLVERQGELVAKQTIMDAVWPDTAVEENNLTVQISALRRVLDQGRTDGSCIQTVPGRGYRFVAPVPDPVPAPEGALPEPEPPEIRTPPARAHRQLPWWRSLPSGIGGRSTSIPRRWSLLRLRRWCRAPLLTPRKTGANQLFCCPSRTAAVTPHRTESPPASPATSWTKSGRTTLFHLFLRRPPRHTEEKRSTCV